MKRVHASLVLADMVDLAICGDLRAVRYLVANAMRIQNLVVVVDDSVSMRRDNSLPRQAGVWIVGLRDVAP
jgi:hypothetical protein